MDSTAGLDQLLFVGTHGHIAAVNKFTGQLVWKRSLPSTGWSVVTLLFEEGVLYAASQGRLFALNPSNGEVAWRNDLPGLGNGHACLATIRRAANADADPIPQIAAAEAAAAAAHSATTS